MARQLRILYRRSAARNVRLYMELQDTLGTFAREGIPVVALKGVVLAVLVYSEPALRPMQDVDLLVRSGDLEAADAALRGLGYASHPSRPPSTWYKEYHHHLAPYLSSDGTVVVEHPSVCLQNMTLNY